MGREVTERQKNIQAEKIKKYIEKYDLSPDYIIKLSSLEHNKPNWKDIEKTKIYREELDKLKSDKKIKFFNWVGLTTAIQIYYPIDISNISNFFPNYEFSDDEKRELDAIAAVKEKKLEAIEADNAKKDAEKNISEEKNNKIQDEINSRFLKKQGSYEFGDKELQTIEKGTSLIFKYPYDEFEEQTLWKSYTKTLFGYSNPEDAVAGSPVINFFKIRKKDGTIFYTLNLCVHAETINAGGKGLKIIFEDGTRFEKPDANVKVKRHKTMTGWGVYDIFEDINDEDLYMFASKKIKAYKIYMYDNKPMIRLYGDSPLILAMGWAKGVLMAV